MLRTLAQKSSQISSRVSNVYSTRTLRTSIKNFSNQPNMESDINRVIESLNELNATQTKIYNQVWYITCVVSGFGGCMLGYLLSSYKNSMEQEQMKDIKLFNERLNDSVSKWCDKIS
jgi:hypothetical protein